eukprot:366074-Chlamydomonas_euryale.AAC.6
MSDPTRSEDNCSAKTLRTSCAKKRTARCGRVLKSSCERQRNTHRACETAGCARLLPVGALHLAATAHASENIASLTAVTRDIFDRHVAS